MADFEQMMTGAGYTRIGSAPAKGNRVKVWWSHPTFFRVEAIYSVEMQGEELEVNLVLQPLPWI